MHLHRWIEPIHYPFHRWRRNHHHSFVWTRLLYGNYLRRLCGEVKADGLNTLRFANRYLIWCPHGYTICYLFVCLGCPRSLPHMTTSWLRCPKQHLRYSDDNIKSLRQLAKCCHRRCRFKLVSLHLAKCRSGQFGCPIVQITLTEEVCHIPPSWLC